MDNFICPKCGGALEEGYIAPQTEAGYKLLAWQRGTPQPIKMFGMAMGTVKASSDGVPVSISRCANCGFLELYAR